MKPILLVFALALVTALAPARDDEHPIKSKSFTVSKGGTLEVAVDGGDIRITPWEKNEVRVNVHGAQDDLEDLHMSSQGNTVRVENYSDGNSGDLRFEISVPSQFDLHIRTSNGLIAVDGPLSGTIAGATSAGDIRLGNLSGSVDMRTSGGDIRAGNIQGDLLVKTSGGDITTGTISGEAELNTSGGDIHIQSAKKSLRAKTSGGNVYVGDVGGETVVSTSGGNVTVGKVSGSCRMLTAGGDIELDGASGEVKAKTAGGNIRLHEIKGTIDAATAGGDVTAELYPGGKGGSRLMTASGEIRVYLPDNSKVTVHARIRVQGRWRSTHSDYHIRSDFPSESYQSDEEDREIRATYQLNGGGETITLETVNADILIRKMGSKQ